MANEFEVRGVDAVIGRLEGIASGKKIHKAMKNAVLRVERSAKQKAQAIKDTGALSRSIKTKVTTDDNNILGIIYSELEYAPYVEYGTGKYAEEGGRSGYWVYVKDGVNEKSNDKQVKIYTLEEAKKVMAILRSKGLEAYYTDGQKARPYLRPALYENEKEIINDLREGVNG